MSPSSDITSIITLPYPTGIYDNEDEDEDDVPLPVNRRNTRDSTELTRTNYMQEKRRRKRAQSLKDWFLGVWYKSEKL
jgi:hypothetical protein